MSPEPSSESSVLLLRLAGPMQSWGDRSSFNRRETRPEPTKSGLVGLLAAALGRPRGADLTDLAGLRCGVRVDQPGTVLRDYHTVSDFRGLPLLQAGVSAKGVQKPTSPAKPTHVTHRFYLQDAVFVAALAGDSELVGALADAVRRPAFPLALGRRSCTPTQPLALDVRPGGLEAVLASEPWHAARHARQAYRRRQGGAVPEVDLPATFDDEDGTDVVNDLPLSFNARDRRYSTRRVRHAWLTVPTGETAVGGAAAASSHDPFALLGW
ncbi:type I-E CRISPR-associated protein Cas5/CasD [Saccharopolyspora gregorii]|uniref:type I-E CRISPR-associated protein Cas5/CasD n=1 Tax=Saccharopolyspora gregorii TaxID=33914 RepID=UPI0021AC2F51|nr:type I-E CRISPR-associated protein Cas5/CasD [Saccharopolyspora gregorii]